MNRLDLLDAMSQAKPALSSQDYVPVLTHFVFDGETLRSYNDSLGIQVEFPSELKCALPGSLLQSLVSKYSSEELKFEVGSDKVEMKCGRNRTMLSYLELKDAIDWMPQEGSSFAEFKADGQFIKGIDRCRLFCSGNAERLEEFGVTLLSDGDGKMALCSTDNVTMSRQTLKLNTYEGDAFKCIIPIAWCDVLIDLTNRIGDEDVQIEVGDGYIMADISGESIVFCKLLEAEPYDFNQTIDSSLEGLDYDKSLTDVPSEFYGALERDLVIQSTQDDKSVSITLSGNVLKMNCSSSLGDADDDITFDTKFPNLDFTCDPEKLVKAGKICSKMAFLDGVVVAKEGSFIHLISHNAED